MIVYTEYPGQAPQVVEDQVTYPLTTAMLTVPKSNVVRGFSFFGVSFVYVIFEDGTDIYWARSRVLEYLNSAARRPASRRDADIWDPTRPASAGSTNMRCAERRRTSPSCAPSRIGPSDSGWPRPRASPRSRASAASSSNTGRPRSAAPAGARHPAPKIRDAIRDSNMDVGGRTVEVAETEYVVRGRGYLKSLDDLEQIVVKIGQGHAGAAQRRRARRARPG